MLAHKPGVLRGPQGQIELFRQYALGNYRNLLLQVAQDPAMLVWLDGKSNTKAKPQENFGREVMELFTVGVGNYTEPDVYAAARVFTGWNLRGSDDYRRDEYGDMNAYQEFVYNADQHDTSAKTFSFPIYSNGSRTIPERSESDGHAGRHRPDHRPGDPSGDGPPAGSEVLELLRQRDPSAGSGLRREHGRRLPAERHRDQAGRAVHPHVAVVQQPVDALRALFVAGGIRRAGDQGGGLAEPLARQGAVAAGQHGPAALRAAERRRMAARRRLVLDGDDAGADEFRRHAGGQPEGIPCRGAASPRAERRRRLLDGDARSRDAGAPRLRARSRR